MELKIAKRKQASIKMALQGPSGSGKSMSALLVAYGLTKDWSKIAVIDTENYSASIYAELGEYSVLNIKPPYAPENYIKALNVCENAGFEVVIIDSISHEWEGSGGILDIHSNMAGNSFTAWGKVTPRHNAFVQAILQTPMHVISTIRTKQDYVINEKNGKYVPEKVGLKGIMKDGMDYEFTLVLDLDIKHNANASKDRTGLFMDKPEFKITQSVGENISKWCNQGQPEVSLNACFKQQIVRCNSVIELHDLFKSHPEEQEDYASIFTQKKMEILNQQH